MITLKIFTVLLAANQAAAGLFGNPFGQITYPPNWTSEWGIRHGYGPSTTTPSTTSTYSSTTTTPEITTTLPYKGKGKGKGKSSQRSRDEPMRSDSPKELHDKCTKRLRHDRIPYVVEGAPKPSTSRAGNSEAKRLGIDGGKEFLKAYGRCKGHDCLGCQNAGERCAATEPSDEEISPAIWGDDSDSDSESEEEEPLPPGQYPWYDVICDTILRAGCCNNCEAGACACGVTDHCEIAIRNGFESRRAYFERYKEKWLKKKRLPLAVYGPYRNSDPQYTTPPAPRGPAIALAGLATLTKCRFGLHSIGPKRRSSDCPPPAPGDAAEAVATAALLTRCRFISNDGKRPWYCGGLNPKATNGFIIRGTLNGTHASFSADLEQNRPNH